MNTKIVVILVAVIVAVSVVVININGNDAADISPAPNASNLPATKGFTYTTPYNSARDKGY